MPLSMRFATSEDAPRIASVHELARASYYGSRLDPTDASRDRQPMWRRMLSEQDRETFVAHRGDEIIGFISTLQEHEPLSYELVGLYILPAYFGTGIALDLYRRFDTRRGNAPAWLEVWDANERAKAFYRKFGWEATEQTRPGVDDIPFVVWTLSPSTPTGALGMDPAGEGLKSLTGNFETLAGP